MDLNTLIILREIRERDKKAPHKLHKFYRGVLLPSFIKFMDYKNPSQVTKILHKTWKEAFNIQTLSEISERKFRYYLSGIQAYLSMEYGFALGEDELKFDEGYNDDVR